MFSIVIVKACVMGFAFSDFFPPCFVCLFVLFSVIMWLS